MFSTTCVTSLPSSDTSVTFVITVLEVFRKSSVNVAVGMLYVPSFAASMLSVLFVNLSP